MLGPTPRGAGPNTSVPVIPGKLLSVLVVPVAVLRIVAIGSGLGPVIEPASGSRGFRIPVRGRADPIGRFVIHRCRSRHEGCSCPIRAPMTLGASHRLTTRCGSGTVSSWDTPTTRPTRCGPPVIAACGALRRGHPETESPTAFTNAQPCSPRERPKARTTRRERPPGTALLPA